MDLAEGTLFIRATAGAASWSKGEAQPNELIALADRALYLAKDRGRNRTETVPHIPKGREPLRRYRSLRLGRPVENKVQPGEDTRSVIRARARAGGKPFGGRPAGAAAPVRNRRRGHGL